MTGDRLGAEEVSFLERATGPAHVTRAVRAHVAADLDRWVDLMGAMVAIDSGPGQLDGVAAVQRMLADALPTFGAEVSQTWHDGVPHLRAALPGIGPPVAIVGHADTVFPSGTAADRPMVIKGGQVAGPGTADMKGGLALAAAVVAALKACATAHPPLEIIVYGDEETRTIAPPDLGGPTPAACLVLECGRPGGGFVTARKAGAWVTLQANGAAAHSGVDPDRGRNAIALLCQAVVAIADLHGSHPGLSVGVGRIMGGTAVNAIPASAQAQIDIRAASTADLDAALAELHALVAPSGVDGAVHLNVAAVERWPAMEPAGPEAKGLAEAYTQVCAAIDLPATPVATGGMSDGSWFASAGVPTIDGLGPIGDMDHSPEEHVDLDSFAPRAGALAGLLHHLAGGPANPRPSVFP